MAKASLSVVTCNYNHAHYIGDALGAILAQSRLPDEVIVIDDGSTDASRAVIQSFSSRYPIVKPVFHDRNQGALVRANEAVAMASGDYLFYAAADDRVLPGFFEKLMALAEQYPEVGLVFCDLLSFSDDDDQMRRSSQPLGTSVRRLTPVEAIKAQQTQMFAIPGASAIFKRAALYEAGGFPEDLRWNTDWFINLVIAFRYGFAYLPGGFSAQRWRADSYHKAGSAVWNSEKDTLRALVRHLDSASCRDVRQAFIESGVLAHFGEKWLRLLFTDPAAIKLLTPRVLRHAVYRAVRDPLKKVLPDTAIGMINRLRSIVGFGVHRNL